MNLSLLLTLLHVLLVHGWHGFDNTEYHCWDLAASDANPTVAPCEGFQIQWLDKPDGAITAQEEFEVTFQLIVSDDFYTFSYNSGYFAGIPVASDNVSAAKNWCETTQCPEAKLATKTNCCVWHVNVHSCPKAEITGKNGLCGPWISPSGQTFTHSDVIVGPITKSNWTCHIAGLYSTGVTSLIAHFRVAGLQIVLETEVTVSPRAVCGDDLCNDAEGETCETCPKDCGKCPLKGWQIGIIAAFSFLAVLAAVAVVIYIQIQKRKLLWDESWIIPFEDIKEDHGHGGFGSVLGSTMGLSTAGSDGGHSIAASAAARQLFVRTAMIRGRTVAVRPVKKKDFSLTTDVRREVRAVRECDHTNLCKFIGASIVAPNIRILTEYCPKGSLSDVLLNDEVPLNWSFRFSFATDIARGMQHLHTHRLMHGHLKSNNCVVDDRWTVKVADFGLKTLRKNDDVMLDGNVYYGDDDDYKDTNDAFYQNKRAKIYVAPEHARSEEFEPTAAGDVYAFAIILIEIATRNDPFGDEDAMTVPECWKPPLPDLSPEASETKDDICPCSQHYLHLIDDCWNDDPLSRPSYDVIKKTLHRINPSKLSPVDLMMAMMEKYSKHLEAIVAERTQDLVAEKAKTDRLLYSMLPRAVADELRHGKSIEAKYYDACTIYFSDIVGFTTISGGSTAMQVVCLLNKLYITFDEIIDKYNVYKVETIGDAYMVVSGIPLVTASHAQEVADMSLDLVEACRNFIIPHMPGEPLRIRVGLHSGSACAGVVGLKMPRYCLFGDTVNTASRMESNGEAYKIHISNYTYEELLKCNKYVLEKRGTIPVKGKGDMVTWWLHGYDPRFLTERAEVQELSAKEDENQNSRASIREPVTNNISHMSIISLEQEMEKIKLQNGSTLPNGKTGSVSSIGGCRVSWGGDKTSQNEVKGILEVDSQSKYSNDHLVKKVNSGAEVKVDTDGCLTPVEDTIPADEPEEKYRRISKISTATFDSGFTDKYDDVIIDVAVADSVNDL